VNLAQTLVLCAWMGVITYLVVDLRMQVRKQAAQPAQPPRPVDPDNPPEYVTVVQVEGDPQSRCTCHGELFVNDDTGLLWPLPTQLLCRKTFEGGQR
jgi:hypothetical protein